jgi:hypothetical protein
VRIFLPASIRSCGASSIWRKEAPCKIER